ncbi:MAG: AsnC family transcriptional regulator [Peptococcaceae bacterium]|nr:AsnC family transcriptional regulator [Peptococcaceae bacterium]
MDFNEADKKLIVELQAGLPLVSRPFAELGERVGLSEAQVLGRVREWKEAGVLRRLGAALRHRKVGYSGNALLVWKIPEDRVGEVGKKFAALPEVSHCYERQVLPQWPYSLYTMVHGATEEACLALAKKLVDLAGVSEHDYDVLYSYAELKKSSMEYFAD